MDTISSMPKLPDAIQINKIIQEYMVVRTAERIAEIDTFVNASNKTNLLIMEVFKGLIASSRV